MKYFFEKKFKRRFFGSNCSLLHWLKAQGLRAMRICIAALGLWLASAELKNPLRTEKKCKSWIKDAFQGRANVKVSRRRLDR